MRLRAVPPYRERARVEPTKATTCKTCGARIVVPVTDRKRECDSCKDQMTLVES